MMKGRGFKLGNKLVKVFKWTIHQGRRTPTATYQRLNQSSGKSSSMSRICRWVRSLKHGAKRFCFQRSDPGYSLVSSGVPKGHLAVYVGEKDDDQKQRYLVPVIYFNHPLLGDLLKEAEKVYGFGHRGGIQIPCRTSEFEIVQRRIEEASRCCSLRRRRCLRIQCMAC